MELSTCLVADVAPLLLPIRDNPISVEGIGRVRGIPMTLSDPSQFFSVKPTAYINNTFVASGCTAGNYSCIAENGGVYVPPANVMRTNSYNGWNGTHDTELEGANYIYFNDLMTIEGKSIPGLPFYTYEPDDDFARVQPAIGLGAESPFLNAAANLSLIPTKQWSFWAGDANDDVDGHVIIGGYDEARVDGDFNTFEIRPSKTMYIDVEDVRWFSSSGNFTSLLEGTSFVSGIGAGLDVYADYMGLPTTVWDNFFDATNGEIDEATDLYAWPSRPSGRLEISFSGGNVFEIAAEDLFSHGTSYDDGGNLNSSTYPFWVSKVRRDSDYPDFALYFGLPFLVNKYLIVDFASSQFHLANAVQGTGSASNIQSLCTGGPPTPDPNPDPPSSGPNVGAIAGGVVGGVAALVLVVFLAFFIRHRRKSAKNKPPPNGPENPTPQQSVPAVPPSPNQPFQQLPPQYLSGVPSNAPVFAEKDGTSTISTAMTHDRGESVTHSAPSGFGELPSPGSNVSRISRGFEYQEEKPPQALVEMPAGRN